MSAPARTDIQPAASAEEVLETLPHGVVVLDAEGRATARMDSAGGVTAFQYDKSGRLVKTTG